MSKLNITNNGKKYISFIALKDYDILYDNSIVIDNNFSMNGNGLNLSFNSKNSIRKNNNSTNTFEFSNNDYVNLDNVTFYEKGIDDSNKVVSILSNGVNIGENSESIVSINSTNNNVKNSETVTLINSKNSVIKNCNNVFNFGTNNSIEKCSDVISIGKNINANNVKKFVVVGSNAKPISEGQVLFGDFKGVNTKNLNVSISHENNRISLNDDKSTHISTNLVLEDSNIINDSSHIDGNFNILLSKETYIKSDESTRNNLLFGKSLYTITSSNNNIIGGNKNTLDKIYSSIILGNNNNSKNESETTIIGENITSTNAKGIFGGSNNIIDTMKDCIIFGYNNKTKSSNNSILIGSNNEVYGQQEIVNGQNNKSLNNTSNGIIIGESFNSNRGFANFYVISNTKSSLIMSDSLMYIGNNDGITYKKFIENFKNLPEFYSKYKYSLYSIDKTHKHIYDKIYIKMHKEGFCNVIAGKINKSFLFCVLKIFVHNDCLYYTNDNKNLPVSNSLGYYAKGDYYYFEVNGASIKESSKCEQIDKNTYSTEVYGLTKKYAINSGLYLVNIKSKDDKLITKNILANGNFYSNNFDNNYEIETLTTKNVTVNNDNIINDDLNISQENAMNYNMFVQPAKVASYIVKNEKSENEYLYDTCKDFLYYIRPELKNKSKNEENFKDLVPSFHWRLLNSMPLFFACLHTIGNYDVRSIPKVNFKYHNVTMEDFAFFNYTDFQQTLYNLSRFKYDITNKSMSLITLNGYSASDVKEYFGKDYDELKSLTRFGSFDTYNEAYKNYVPTNVNSKLYTSATVYYSQGESYEIPPEQMCYDNIIRFTRTGEEVKEFKNDFIMNHSDTFITKWGMFANVQLPNLSPIQTTKKVSDVNKIDNFKCMKLYGLGGYANYSYKMHINDREIEGPDYKGSRLNDYANTTYLQFNEFTQTTDENDSNFYLPFASLNYNKNGHLCNEEAYYDYYKKINQYYISLTPMNRALRIIKPLTCFLTYTEMVLEFNTQTLNENSPRKFYVTSTNPDGKTSIVSFPLFIGVLNFSDHEIELKKNTAGLYTNYVDFISDYTYDRNNRHYYIGNKTFANSKHITNITSKKLTQNRKFLYDNIIWDSYDFMRTKNDFDDKIIFTYMLKCMNTKIISSKLNIPD